MKLTVILIQSYRFCISLSSFFWLFQIGEIFRKRGGHELNPNPTANPKWVTCDLVSIKHSQVHLAIHSWPS